MAMYNLTARAYKIRILSKYPNILLSTLFSNSPLSMSETTFYIHTKPQAQL
jgi:hypothetical protein